MQKEIEIKIKPDGSIDVEMLNFKGQGCAESAAKFIEALGRSVKVDKKQEYYDDHNKNDGCQQNRA